MQNMKLHIVLFGVLTGIFLNGCQKGLKQSHDVDADLRQRISINSDWRFMKYSASEEADHLIYAARPEVANSEDGRPADAKPTEAVAINSTQEVLKPRILPTGNNFIKDPSKRYARPEGNPGGDFPYVLMEFDESSWEKVNLPHDWAIDGPFYEGEGIRDAPAYEGLPGIRTSPLCPLFHETFPDKLIISSENAAALSSRGEYTFPVTEGMSAPVKDGFGANSERQQVSGYELYMTPFGSSADKVFAPLDKHPFVAGGFVWSGWDYLGEPTPYYSARSSYCGVIDLAGFRENRFYLYQSYWRPELAMAHIVPHWTRLDRIGKVTPVYVFTSGDQAELFVNGRSLGRKRKGEYEYRLRWDSVVYEPGHLKVVTYKNGSDWAIDSIITDGEAVRLELRVDRDVIKGNGADLSFETVRVLDVNNVLVPDADNLISFEISGPGEIMATDNGVPTSFNPFPSHERKVFHGLALVIVRSAQNNAGQINITAKSKGLKEDQIVINSQVL